MSAAVTGADVDVEVVVVGVGGFGAAALFHLASRGVDVVGVERHGNTRDVVHGLGSSTGETRVIRKAYFEDPRYVPLLHRADALWTQLERDVGEPLFERAGCLTFGPPAHDALVGVRDSVTTHALPHELLDDVAIARRFPALRPARGDVGVFEVDAGFLHVERCTRAHANEAQRHGARLLAPARVTALRPHDDGVDVELDVSPDGDGEHRKLRARQVVVAAGPWLAHDPVLARFAPQVPLAVERQVQLWFDAGPKTMAGALPCFIHFGERGAFYGIPGRPEAPALKACRHHGGVVTDPDRVDRDVAGADVDDVRSFLRAHLPVADREPVRGKVCLYTNTPDDHFVVGRSPLSSRVVVVGGCSGHGYKMASVVGEIAADLVTTGESAFDLGLFRLDR